ncbi:hypothetical protein GJ744_009114 [Endocarpon pusillum]|uniref:Uncharacterized protein n=1 Tax=Endocarpon pusillum TaxID=364733 RepID=A0A8H7AP06_9EURO|nr:hypothetical protein GJ744_009114 [Endocarpon pusillum]
MRLPRTEDSLTLSTATYRLERRAMTRANESSPSSGPASQRYILRPCIYLQISPLPDSDHNCWQLLFNSCIVADSALLRYRDFGRGLETSFDLMISLAAAEFHLIIEGGLVFIGYQAVLFPTAIQGDCAQFHLITSNDGQINPYTLDLGKRVLTDDPFQFKAMRCFLGWCEAAQINLGTKQLPATFKYSGGRNQGESLQLDGYSMLAQVGASAPLSAVLGLQTNFKYTSHRRQFTPLRNYCKLLQNTSRELAIVYDAAQRRCWLVPKLSLLLHMSQAYTFGCVGVPDGRVPYVEPHADAVGVIQILEPLGDTLISGGQSDKFLFRELMLGLNTNLLGTVASTRKSSGKWLYGFEFMDVVTEPGRGTCMKRLDILSLGKNWLDIVNAVDAVVVCSELGEAITAVEGSARKSPKCNVLPKDLDYLAATLPCLARLAERRGGEVSARSHHINIAENTLWKFSGDPFQECQHNNTSNETCWRRSDLVQRLVSERYFGLPVSVHAPNPLPMIPMPVSGAVVFGKPEIITLQAQLRKRILRPSVSTHRDIA